MDGQEDHGVLEGNIIIKVNWNSVAHERNRFYLASYECIADKIPKIFFGNGFICMLKFCCYY